jgi:hypothetical protein
MIAQSQELPDGFARLCLRARLVTALDLCMDGAKGLALGLAALATQVMDEFGACPAGIDCPGGRDGTCVTCVARRVQQAAMRFQKDLPPFDALDAGQVEPPPASTGGGNA